MPLAINITMALAFLGGFFLPLRWMLATWLYCGAAYYVIEYFYPEYWTNIMANMN